MRGSQHGVDCFRIDLIVPSPSSPACSYSKSTTSLWLLLLQTSGSLPWTTAPCLQSQHQLHGTVLNKWNTITMAMYWTAEGIDGVPGCWPDDFHLNRSLWWRPCRQLDLMSWSVCPNFKVKDTWRKKKKIHLRRKTAYVAWKIEGAWLKLYSFWLISHLLLIRVSEVHCQISGSDLQSIPRWNWKLCISIWNSQRSKHTFLSPIWIMHAVFFFFFFFPFHTTNTWGTSKNSGRTNKEFLTRGCL